MKQEQLTRGNELLGLIKITQKALLNLEKVMSEHKTKQLKYNDSLYNLCVTQHTDGSGFKADLGRCSGNEKLLEVIIQELKRQIIEFQDEFDKL